MAPMQTQTLDLMASACQETRDLHLSNIGKSKDVQTLNQNITEAILRAAQVSIPKGCHSKYKPFWNDKIQESIEASNAREDARKRLENDPTPENKTAYNRTSAQVKRTVKTAKQHKWANSCAELDLSKGGTKAWTLLNNLSGQNRRTNPKPMISDGETITEHQKKAEPTGQAVYFLPFTNDNTWKRGVIATRHENDRSYDIDCSGKTFTRNRRHINPAFGEPPKACSNEAISIDDESTLPAPTQQEPRHHQSDLRKSSKSQAELPSSPPKEVSPNLALPTPSHYTQNANTPYKTRSGRVVRKPNKYTE
ncbi:hypothetical protein EGW08_023596 [Elysia chlorotica]|uniref:Uncharacterized protein n=1 Tax=Elysia chlorotica TaxID=188477 RepID=A0A433SIC6_ELYCH|nr:hypothetical protein EGW08_023596 [Elysia chlorotica]